jgi:3-oxoacyl-[acyl-carrier protein] reductase
MKLLEGKVAIVTGAARGLGRAIANTFAVHGASLVLVDVDREGGAKVQREIELAGGQAVSLMADVTVSREVDAAVQQAVEQCGTVDILVNNVGRFKPMTLLEMEEEDWDEIIGVNLKSVYLFSRAVARIMVEKRSGRIINVASVAGRSSSPVAGAHYTTAKAGVLGFTRHLARELASYGINVNAVAPGTTRTESVKEMLTKDAESQLISRIPLGRLAEPQDTANAVLFLASDMSSYITGATLDVNGGQLMM